METYQAFTLALAVLIAIGAALIQQDSKKWIKERENQIKNKKR